jgi:hypothetical protein
VVGGLAAGRLRRAVVGGLATGLVLVAGGCGFQVQSPDLFTMTRTGAGGSQSVLVNDGGTIRCNGGRSRKLADPLLLRARDLVATLDNDAKRGLRIAATRGSVFHYTIKFQDGTISFPDTASKSHSELAQAELLAVQLAQQACGISG